MTETADTLVAQAGADAIDQVISGMTANAADCHGLLEIDDNGYGYWRAHCCCGWQTLGYRTADDAASALSRTHMARWSQDHADAFFDARAYRDGVR